MLTISKRTSHFCYLHAFPFILYLKSKAYHRGASCSLLFARADPCSIPSLRTYPQQVRVKSFSCTSPALVHVLHCALLPSENNPIACSSVARPACPSVFGKRQHRYSQLSSKQFTSSRFQTSPMKTSIACQHSTTCILSCSAH